MTALNKLIAEKDAEIVRQRAVVDAATNLVRAQGKQIDECWQVLDDAVDAYEAALNEVESNE